MFQPAEMGETGKWPADQVERRAVASLVPYARNARRHRARQIAELADLIREYGWTIPVLIDEDGQIIAGHGRVLAAQQLDLVDIPVIVARGWTDTQKRAYRLADNEVAAHSDWNKELLRVELADLAQQAVDLSSIGFSAADALIQPDAKGGELPQALQLQPAREYALIMCADLDEWERLKVELNLTPVRRGGYRKGSEFDDTGTQRVVAAADLLKLLNRPHYRGDASYQGELDDIVLSQDEADRLHAGFTDEALERAGRGGRAIVRRRRAKAAAAA